MAWRVAALVLVAAVGGCIELVDDAPADGPTAGDRRGDDASSVSVALQSNAKNTIDLVLLSARGDVDLAQNGTSVRVQGLACRSVSAGNDTLWSVGEAVRLTVQTGRCGLVIESGQAVEVAVTVRGTEVHRGVVTVR